jgi:hypothetical protein
LPEGNADILQHSGHYAAASHVIKILIAGWTLKVGILIDLEGIKAALITSLIRNATEVNVA